LRVPLRLLRGSSAIPLRLAPRPSGRSARPNQLYQPREDSWIGVRKHAVAEIEDVAGTAACAAEDIERPGLDALPGAQQGRRVEVALNTAVADLGPGAVELDAPVDADYVAAGRGHVPKQRGSAGAEMDRRNLDCRQDPRGVRRDELVVIPRR